MNAKLIQTYLQARTHFLTIDKTYNTKMSYQDPTASSIELLNSMSSAHESASEFYASASSLLESKLYHQLTVEILSFTSSPTNCITLPDSSTNFSNIYNILFKLKSKLNPLMLTRIACNVSRDTDILSELMATDEIQSAPHAKLFAQAKLHLLTLMANPSPSSDIVSTIQTFLKENKITLQQLSASTESEIASVHSAYHQTAMHLAKITGPAQNYYHSAIEFLHYTPLTSLSEDEKKTLATDLCLAALMGEGVYNLGTVVYDNQGLLECLKGTENQYLVDLMTSAAEGSVLSDPSTLQEYEKHLAQKGCDVKVVEEKIMLLALIHMVFEKESHDRLLKFSEIADRLMIGLEQVEWVVMKALSLGLIKVRRLFCIPCTCHG